QAQQPQPDSKQTLKTAPPTHRPPARRQHHPRAVNYRAVEGEQTIPPGGIFMSGATRVIATPALALGAVLTAAAPASRRPTASASIDSLVLVEMIEVLKSLGIPAVLKAAIPGIGLPRRYSPKGTDLSRRDPDEPKRLPPAPRGASRSK